eukprot:6569489-Prymnesium_polylepis.1
MALTYARGLSGNVTTGLEEETAVLLRGTLSFSNNLTRHGDDFRCGGGGGRRTACKFGPRSVPAAYGGWPGDARCGSAKGGRVRP